MARCSGCDGGRCGCKIIAGANTTVTGIGSAENPYVVSAAGEESGSMPTGSIIMFGTGTPPAGYLVANGAAVNRVTYAALYAVIGTLYGAGDGSTTFNLPDLAGTFPLGAVPGGGAPWVQDGVVKGNTNGLLTLATNQLPTHTHTINHTHANALTSGHTADHAHVGITSDAGAHNHGVPASTGGAGGGAAYQAPTNSQIITTTAGLHNHSMTTGGASSDHQHFYQTPAFTGTSGNGSDTGLANAPVNIMPPYLAVTFLIKT